MILRGFLHRFQKGDPVASVCNTTHHNRVADILENIEGYGCRIDKPIDGSPWTIYFDGTSDQSPLNDTPPCIGYPYGELWTCGIMIAANVVTVYNARARRMGERNADGTNKTWQATTTDVTFSDGANQRIIWEWDPSAGLLILATPQVNDPSDAPPIIRGILGIFDCTSGQCRVSAGGSDQLGHLIPLPIFAPADA